MTPSDKIGDPQAADQQSTSQHWREQQELDRELDRELEGTFPASDPPAITRPRGHKEKSATDARARAQSSDKSDADEAWRSPSEPSPPALRPGRQRPAKR
jgi:hypothetical protein